MAGLGNLNNLRFDNKGVLPNTVSTMKKTTPTEGATGQLAPLMGAAALGPAAPLVAPFLNPVVGSGLSGALATIATSPSQSEAGIFVNLGRDVGAATKGAFKGSGRWTMSDGRQMFEIPTDRIANGMATGKPFNSLRKYIDRIDTSKQGLANLDKQGIDKMDAIAIKNAENNLMNHNQKQLGFVDNVINPKLAGPVNKFLNKEKQTNGYMHRTKPKTSYISKYISNKSSGNTGIHEPNHGQQALENDAMMMSNSYRDDVPYGPRRHEIESRMAGFRAGFPKQLTDANSKYGIHPEIVFDKRINRFSHSPEHAVSTNSYNRFADEPFVPMEQAGKRNKNLINEANRLTQQYNKDKNFMQLVNNAHKNQNPYQPQYK